MASICLFDAPQKTRIESRRRGFERIGSVSEGGRTGAGFDSTRHPASIAEWNRSRSRIHEMVPEAKIILLSENSSAESVQEAMSLGASAYVVKAMVAIELLTVVETVLSGMKVVSI